MPPPRATRPTTGQKAAYQALLEHGTQAAAARALGRHQGSIRGDVLRYCELTGTPLPPGVSGLPRTVSPTRVMSLVPDRITALEGEVRGLRADVSRLTGLIQLFVNRQPVVLEVRGRHTRKADGGESTRNEVKSVVRKVG